MTRCAYCKTETEHSTGGVPECLKCAEERQSKRESAKSAHDAHYSLLQNVLEATHKLNDASREFELLIGQFPSGLPHPDGAQQIKNVSAKLALARQEMMMAHNQLNEFIMRGILPKNLKR